MLWSFIAGILIGDHIAYIAHRQRLLPHAPFDAHNYIPHRMRHTRRSQAIYISLLLGMSAMAKNKLQMSPLTDYQLYKLLNKVKTRGGGKSKWKLVLIFAAVTRYTPLAGLGFLQGPHPTPTAATSKPHGWGQAGELHQRGWREAAAGPSARPNGAGCSPQKTALPGGAAQTQKLNVIKTHTNMTTLDLNAYGVQELSSKEMQQASGGMTTEELIQLCWDATPDGCNATFTPYATGWDHGFDMEVWGSLPECGCY